MHTNSFWFGDPLGNQSRRASKVRSRRYSNTPKKFVISSENKPYVYRDYDYLRKHFFKIVDDPSPEKAYELLQELKRNYRYFFEYKVMLHVLQQISGTEEFAFGQTWSHEFDRPPEFAEVSVETFGDIFTVEKGKHEIKIDPAIFCYKGKAFRFYCNGHIGSETREKMLHYYMTQLIDKYSSVLTEPVPYCQYMPCNELLRKENLDPYDFNLSYHFETDESMPIPFTNPSKKNFKNREFLDQLFKKTLAAKDDFMVTFLIFLTSHRGGHTICCFAHVIILESNENGYMKKDVEITLVDNNGIEIYSLDAIYDVILRDIRVGLFDENQDINFSLREKINHRINYGRMNNYMRSGHCHLISCFIAELGWYIANTLPRDLIKGYFSYFIKSVIINLYNSGTETIQSLTSTYYISVMGTFFDRVSNENSILQKHEQSEDVFVFKNSDTRLNRLIHYYAQNSLYLEGMRNECIITLIGIELPNSKNDKIYKLPDFLKLRRQKMNGVSFFVPDMNEIYKQGPSEQILKLSSMLDGTKQLALDVVNNKYKYGNIDDVDLTDDMPEDWKFLFLSPKRAISTNRKLCFREICHSDFSYMVDNKKTYLHLPRVIINPPLTTNVLLTRRLTVLEIITERINSLTKEDFTVTVSIGLYIILYSIIIFLILDMLLRYSVTKDSFRFGNEGQIITNTLNATDYPNLMNLGRNADNIIQEAQSLSSKQKKKAFNFFIQNFQKVLELTPEEMSSVSAMLGIYK